MDRLLTGGGYMPLTNPAEELVRLGHGHDVPVYPCINCDAPIPGNDAELRAAASNLLWAGADGIYLWNYHYRLVARLGYGRPGDEAYDLLDEIGSASALQYRDKGFSLEREVGVTSYARACHPAQLPAKIDGGGRGTALQLRVGDDVAAVERAGRLAKATLRLGLSGVPGGTTAEVDLNGTALGSGATSDGAVTLEVAGSAVRQDDNQLLVSVAGSATAVLETVSLGVGYR